MITTWRSALQSEVDIAFTGALAARSPGAWNHYGGRVVYLLGSRAVAMTEVLARFRNSEATFVLFKVEIPDDLVIEERAAAPDSQRARDVTRAMGAAWLARGSSAVLRVPSGMVKGEFNYVANPLHADFKQVRVARPEPFLYHPGGWR